VFIIHLAHYARLHENVFERLVFDGRVLKNRGSSALRIPAERVLNRAPAQRVRASNADINRFFRIGVLKTPQTRRRDFIACPSGFLTLGEIGLYGSSRNSSG
jgi:hypothetical protein